MRKLESNIRQSINLCSTLIGLIVWTALLLVLTAWTAAAAPGDLDTTFGNGGIVITRGNSIDHLDSALGMAIQPDGKIVLVGEGALGNNYDFAVVRYNTDGSLDFSFGGTGIVITPIQSGSPDQAFSVAIQADGKIVVAGSSGNIFALVRYNPDGSLDTSFNGTGKVISGNSSYARDLAIQADGKIVAVGGEGALRFNTDGSPDTSFGGTGRIFLGIDEANSVAIQADGKIVSAGRLQNSFALVRHNTDGSPDTSFNGTGKVITPVGNSGSRANSVAIQADGKIVAVGDANLSVANKTDFALVRYNPNGSLDTTFGGSGKIIIPVGNFGDYAYSVAIQTDSKIVVAGNSYSSSNGSNITRSEFAVVRFNPNGSLDTTFGGTGKVITRIGISYDGARSVAIQADGKIVVAGSTDGLDLFDFYDFAVVRYQGGSSANIRTRFDFDGDGKADVSVFRPSDRVWYLNQSTNGFSATQFGLSTDNLTPADYDGDGKTDFALYRDGTWYLLRSTAGFIAVQFGLAGDIPQPADFDGDGRAELTVYRGGNWFTLNLANNQVNTVQFGISSDKPVVGDYDGDGLADQAVYRDGVWYLNRSTQGFTSIQFGLSTDKLVPADYDGDGKTDQAVYRDGVWYLLGSQTGFTTFQFGLASDIPAPADYDGDGRTDAAVFRDGVWYLRQTTSGTSIQHFGLADDKPVPAAFLP